MTTYNRRRDIDRIRMEYLEMPDLRLSAPQVRRMWTLDTELCDELLATLVREGFLRRAADGTFLRSGDGRPKPPSAPLPSTPPPAAPLL